MTKKELTKFAKYIKSVRKAIKATKKAKSQLAKDEALDMLSDSTYLVYHYGKSIGL